MKKGKGSKQNIIQEELGVYGSNALNTNVNSLLGFQYQDESDGKPGGNRGKRRKFASGPVFNKEQYIQAAFKFVLKPPKSKDSDDYLKYLIDPA